MRNPVNRVYKKSFSQEGEDILLSRMFEGKKEGFYIDIGAHHPKRFSNTYWAYRRGWKGICIDPQPGIKKKFTRSRPKDIFLELGVGEISHRDTYFEFSDAALNTLDEERARFLIQNTKYKLIKKVEIEIYRLENILKQHLPNETNDKIDFLSLDVEGFELSVLKSNNFYMYKPTILVIEVMNIDIVNIVDNEIVRYLDQYGYEVSSILYHSVFFIKKNSELNWKMKK